MPSARIRRCVEDDLEELYEIVNDGAQAYRGHVPPDCLHDPYMSRDELRREIEGGVKFWGYQEDRRKLAGVMGIQNVKDVTLIRHAYVRSSQQHKGVGGHLLQFLRTLTNRPVLIGTWAAADWAIRFYEHHGFELVTFEEKNRLLKKYWTVPERQIETSVVLVQKDRRG